MKADVTLLLTGAGAPGTRGTLYALRNNPDGVRIRTIGTDVKPGGVGPLWMDAFYQVPPPEAPGYLDAVSEICRREAVDLVIPQTTRELFAFARVRDSFGVPVMVSNERAISVANNKWELLQVVSQMGLPYPAYHLARSETELVDATSQLGYPGNPVVVKPPVSNGMRGFRVLREDAWDAARFLAEKPNGVEVSLRDLCAVLRRGEWPELLVTEYLPGAEYSVDAFIGAQTQLAVPRLRKAIRSGISFENDLEYRDDLIDDTLRLGRQIGLSYAFGFQFKLDAQGTPKVLECNPRLQGTMVASLFSGANIIWMAVREALGSPPAGVPETLKPASFLRFWGGIGISGESAYEI